MKLAAVTALILLFVSVPLCADDKDTDFDAQTDFSKFKTFTLRQGQNESKSPELNSPLVRKKIEDSIRSQLIGKGLTEEKWNNLQLCGRGFAARRATGVGKCLVFRWLFGQDASAWISPAGRVADDDVELHREQFPGQEIERRAADRGAECRYVVDRQ